MCGARRQVVWFSATPGASQFSMIDVVRRRELRDEFHRERNSRNTESVMVPWRAAGHRRNRFIFAHARSSTIFTIEIVVDVIKRASIIARALDNPASPAANLRPRNADASPAESH